MKKVLKKALSIFGDVLCVLSALVFVWFVISTLAIPYTTRGVNRSPLNFWEILVTITQGE